MTRDSVSVILPTPDTTQSVATSTLSATAINAANGVIIPDALANKNNSLSIVVTNASTASASNVILVKSDLYPNALLGNCTISVPQNSTMCIQLQDISRFEQKDGSILINFSSGYSGTIYAVAKSAGVVSA
ncbi:hypothetical protein IJI31_04115 [bacterium]|nr:hypothetical protein [bacterium]